MTLLAAKKKRIAARTITNGARSASSVVLSKIGINGGGIIVILGGKSINIVSNNGDYQIIRNVRNNNKQHNSYRYDADTEYRAKCFADYSGEYHQRCLAGYNYLRY